jgi:hypothetical protein
LRFLEIERPSTPFYKHTRNGSRDITAMIAHSILFPRVNNGDEYGDRSKDDKQQQGDVTHINTSNSNISKGGIIAIVRRM